jgi:hypothetical protein
MFSHAASVHAENASEASVGTTHQNKQVKKTRHYHEMYIRLSNAPTDSETSQLRDKQRL